MSNKIALITGINGQDGSYLSEFLIKKGYEVHGTLKRNSVAENQTSRLDNIFNQIKLHYADLTDLSSLISVIQKTNPDEIYNLAAQSHVRISFDQPIYTANVTGLGTLNMFISNGILFNHESPRRGTNFVTNKVCKEAVKIKLGLSNELKLGNLDATRDWGHAKDYVRAMWEILQLENPDDFVCSTGISHSVGELCDYVFSSLGLDYKQYVTQDEKFLRPEELHDLKGDSSKLVNTTGWSHDYTFETMLDEMIDYWMDYYTIK
jgi:GDPmannose 4,6-dehydratase